MKIRSMKASSIKSIEIDRKKVLNDINENGQFEADGILIRKMEVGEDEEEEEGEETYVAEINKNNSSFIGILNSQFKREGYGLNKLENGDQYLGYFEDDQRNKHGIYIWNPERKGKNIMTECYYGFWKADRKEKNGIYIWLEEPKKNDQFDKANFNAYIGEFEDDTYKRGTYLSKIGDEYYLYHGKFDKEGRKSDDNAYFYSSKNDRLLHGRVSRDNFMSGYVSVFDSNTGSLKDLAYCTFDKEGNPLNIISKDELQKEEKEREIKAIVLFRNIILDVDYFGYIYVKFKEIKNFMDKKVDSVEVFEDPDKFPKLMKICSGYNTKNIYNEIEKNIEKKNK